jgi:fructokinase
MIICAGESLVDVIPAVDPTQPDQAVPGGGPMNAAVAAARLGVPTAFVGRVSSDAYGDLIWSHLEASGVVLDAAQRGPEPTARAIVTTQPIQSFRFEGDNTADASMTAVDLGPLGTGPHILHAGTLGIFRGDTAHALRAMLDGFNGVVSFDPNIRPQVFPSVDEWLLLADPWLSRAAVVKASDEDLDWMGMKVDDVLARGAKVVFRTAGSAGVDVFLANGQRFTVQAKPVTVACTEWGRRPRPTSAISTPMVGVRSSSMGSKRRPSPLDGWGPNRPGYGRCPIRTSQASPPPVGVAESIVPLPTAGDLITESGRRVGSGRPRM